MFLNHQTYEDLKNLIGEEAAATLAYRYGGQNLYFPRTSQEGQTRSPQLQNGLIFPDVRSFICDMRREGATAIKICAALKAKWPDDPGKHVSKSAMSRFFARIRQGRMREFGIDDNFRMIDG